MKMKGYVIMALALGVFVLAGCVGNIWDQYAAPQYGRERAEQICHPYGHCTQGKWIAGDPALEDPNEAHMMCKKENLRNEDEWSKNTVSLGLEINRCMTAKGYTLVSQ